MDIEKQILDEPASVSIDRTEVQAWLEIERSRINRATALKFSGMALLAGCLLGLIYQLLESESQKIKQLVGTRPSSHAVMLEEITVELCGEKPAEYWGKQISLTRHGLHWQTYNTDLCSAFSFLKE